MPLDLRIAVQALQEVLFHGDLDWFGDHAPQDANKFLWGQPVVREVREDPISCMNVDDPAERFDDLKTSVWHGEWNYSPPAGGKLIR